MNKENGHPVTMSTADYLSFHSIEVFIETFWKHNIFLKSHSQTFYEARAQ